MKEEGTLKTSKKVSFDAEAIKKVSLDVENLVLHANEEVKFPEDTIVGNSAGQWELTWPIWHLLPIRDRKEIASRHNMNIGQFEEYMYLQNAIESSADKLTASLPGGNSGPTFASGSTNSFDDQPKKTLMLSDFEEEDEDDDCESVYDDSEVIDGKRKAIEKSENTENEYCNLGLPLTLPDEILHRIMTHLPIESYYTCALVHPSWASFTTDENAYRIMCQRCYLNQSRRKVLSLQRWKTYKNMITHRPRVRTDGGIYIMKYAQIMKIQRDMWTEVPWGAILETVYYRYLIFREDQTVLYSLTPLPPHEMIPKFVKMNLSGQNDNKNRIEVGKYEVNKFKVRVWVEHKWTHVCLELDILPHGVFGAEGKFCALTFDKHLTSVNGNFESNNVVEHAVPSEDFKFLRDRRL
mmetsp:Transcript_28673/g.32968  ORF Transcript_28673/g.32968 Transcript_28673/m.32968 type:complete len:409 (-) Transcript_28673:156-1382(-)